MAEQRQYSIGVKPTLEVDSGWDRNGVRLDFSTSRGQVVSLTVPEWKQLVNAVEMIIDYCEMRRKEQMR